MPKAIVLDRAENDLNFVGSQRLELFPCLRNVVDERGYVSDELSFLHELLKNLRQGANHEVASSWAPFLSGVSCRSGEPSLSLSLAVL